MTHEPTSLDVVVLSCGDLGFEVAQALSALPAVRHVSVVTAPYSRKQLTPREKLRHVYRAQGPWRLLSGVVGKVARSLRRRRGGSDPDQQLADHAPPAIPHLRFPDFHHPDCIAALRTLGPDLGVIAGTYILKPAVFEIPRLGSINLHSGKAPEYRGAAPAFWELYNGESEVGITIHRVAAALDAGHILLQELFPLDPSPAEDPLDYLEEYRRSVLRPNGVRMLAETVSRIANHSIEEREQDHARARTYRTPDYKAIRELRRRVRDRRRRVARTPAQVPAR